MEAKNDKFCGFDLDESARFNLKIKCGCIQKWYK